MHITANIFDNFYPFIVIIFFIISILSSIMKKKMKDSAQQNKTNYNIEEEYEIRHEEQEKPQYDYYKTKCPHAFQLFFLPSYQYADVIRSEN